MKPTKAYLKALKEYNKIYPEYLVQLKRYIEAGKMWLYPPREYWEERYRLGARLSSLEHRLVLESKGRWQRPTYEQEKKRLSRLP